MADIYTNAHLSPGKPDAVAAGLRARGLDPEATAENISLLASYRLDDPAGEVGMEIHLVADAEGRTLQVPLTYRGAPLEGAKELLTLEHSILGRRWVYDGIEDPLLRACLVRAIALGDSGARYTNAEDGTEITAGVATVRGTGVPGATADALPSDENLGFRSVLDPDEEAEDLDGIAGSLVGTWPGRGGTDTDEVRLAVVRA